MDETEAIKLAQDPSKLISAGDCNEVLSYLNEYINVLVAFEWEQKLVASQHKVNLLSRKDKTDALAKAEWEVSKEYLNWQEKLRELRKFRAYRNLLQEKFAVLSNLRRY